MTLRRSSTTHRCCGARPPPPPAMAAAARRDRQQVTSGGRLSLLASAAGRRRRADGAGAWRAVAAVGRRTTAPACRLTCRCDKADNYLVSSHQLLLINYYSCLNITSYSRRGTRIDLINTYYTHDRDQLMREPAPAVCVARGLITRCPPPTPSSTPGDQRRCRCGRCCSGRAAEIQGGAIV